MVDTARPVAQDLISVLTEMVADYHRLQDRRIPQPRKNVAPARFAFIASLNAHAHALGEASLPMWSSPTTFAAVPSLCRTALECGLMAQWISRDPEAVDAAVAAWASERHKLAVIMAKVPTMAKRAGAVDQSVPTKHPKAEIARRADKLAAQFDAGEEIYAYFKMLSASSHGGLEAAEQWLVGPASVDGKFTVRRGIDPVLEYAVFIVLGMLHTATAFGDVAQVNSNYPNRLNRYRKRVELGRRLLLSPRPNSAVAGDS